MTFPTIPVVIGVGVTGVAAILGYLIYTGKKPGAASAAAAVPKKIPAAKSAGGGGGGGGGAKPATDWKLTGYRAGLAQGKADKQAGRPWGASFKKSESPPSSVPTGTDPKTTLTLRALWTLGWIEGYPVGYGGDASGKVAKAPKYAVDAYSTEEWDAVTAEESGTEEMAADATETDATSTDESTTTDVSTDSSTTETETETAGVRTGQGMAIYYHPTHRPAGAWGPQRHVLAHAKKGAFTATGAKRLGGVARPTSAVVERPTSAVVERPTSAIVEPGPPNITASSAWPPPPPGVANAPRANAPGTLGSVALPTATSFFDSPNVEVGPKHTPPSPTAIREHVSHGGVTPRSNFYGYR